MKGVEDMTGSVSAGNGFAWVTDGWGLVSRALGTWVMITLIVFGIQLLCGLIPLVGSLAAPFLGTLLGAGQLQAARKLQLEGRIEVGDIFGVFSHPRRNALLLVTLIYLALSIAVSLVAIGVFGLGGGLFAALASGDEVVAAGASVIGALFGILVLLVILFPIIAMYWFAVPLVLFGEMDPWPAMKRSLSACFANVMALTVFGLVVFVLMLLAAIPLMLGYLVLMPLLVAAWLLSYQDIFAE